MIFSKLKRYKLVEFDKGLILIDEGDDLTQRPGTQPLMIGNAGECITYLDRYVYEREAGTSMREAHETALKTAGITVVHPTPGKVS